VFFDDVTGLLRILVVAPLAYVWLIAVLRCSGKRTLAQLTAFDFIVTVGPGLHVGDGGSEQLGGVV